MDIVQGWPPIVNSTLTYQSKPYDPIFYRFSRSVNARVPGWILPQAVLPVAPHWLKDQLINDALKGIQDQSVNLALFFREIDQTSKLISNTAKKIDRSMANVARGKFAAAARDLGILKPKGVSRTKSYADNLLAYKFGVVPLVMDCVGAVKHLAERGLAVNIIGKASDRKLSNRSESRTETMFDPGVELEFVITKTANWVEDVRQRVKVLYKLRSDFWREGSQLGFTNGGVQTWEAIPYSFVIDTFLSVGDWLGNMDLGLGLDFASASYTRFVRNRGNCNAKGSWIRMSNLSTNYRQSTRPTNEPFEVVKMERQELSSSDMVFSLLFRSPLSVNNAINDIALVRQRLPNKL